MGFLGPWQETISRSALVGDTKTVIECGDSTSRTAYKSLGVKWYRPPGAGCPHWGESPCPHGCDSDWYPPEAAASAWELATQYEFGHTSRTWEYDGYHDEAYATAISQLGTREGIGSVYLRPSASFMNFYGVPPYWGAVGYTRSLETGYFSLGYDNNYAFYGNAALKFVGGTPALYESVGGVGTTTGKVHPNSLSGYEFAADSTKRWPSGMRVRFWFRPGGSENPPPFSIWAVWPTVHYGSEFPPATGLPNTYAQGQYVNDSTYRYIGQCVGAPGGEKRLLYSGAPAQYTTSSWIDVSEFVTGPHIDAYRDWDGNNPKPIRSGPDPVLVVMMNSIGYPGNSGSMEEYSRFCGVHMEVEYDYSPAPVNIYKSLPAEKSGSTTETLVHQNAYYSYDAWTVPSYNNFIRSSSVLYGDEDLVLQDSASGDMYVTGYYYLSKVKLQGKQLVRDDSFYPRYRPYPSTSALNVYHRTSDDRVFYPSWGRYLYANSKYGSGLPYTSLSWGNEDAEYFTVSADGVGGLLRNISTGEMSAFTCNFNGGDLTTVALGINYQDTRKDRVRFLGSRYYYASVTSSSVILVSFEHGLSGLQFSQITLPLGSGKPEHTGTWVQINGPSEAQMRLVVPAVAYPDAPTGSPARWINSMLRYSISDGVLLNDPQHITDNVMLTMETLNSWGIWDTSPEGPFNNYPNCTNEVVLSRGTNRQVRVENTPAHALYLSHVLGSTEIPPLRLDQRNDAAGISPTPRLLDPSSAHDVSSTQATPAPRLTWGSDGRIGQTFL